MVVFPNCKINLGLFITNRRTDGYHDLETVFYPVKGLRDALEIVPSKTGETSLSITGKSVAGNTEQNLVWKAFQLLEKVFGDKMKPAEIHLHKVIPMGAGMGGGSADGAFALRLFNDFFELDQNDDQLAAYAFQLGSDCPFFIYNTPQFASGRGEQFTPVHIDLSTYSLQIICPEIHVSTATAFGMITPTPAACDLRNLGNLPVSAWKEKVVNDFEVPVFAKHPELSAIKDRLYADGAIYAGMSGSGSSVYGIFEKGGKSGLDGFWFG